MKKKTFFPLLALIAFLSINSCSKSAPEPATTTVSLDGKWVGTYNNGAGGPANYFALTFKSGGALVVHANNSLIPDVANGSWAMVSDSIKATYSYSGSSAVYSLAAKFTGTSTLLSGTVGLSPATTGEAVFTVNKQP